MSGKTKVKCTVKDRAARNGLAWRLTRGGHTISHGKSELLPVLQQVLNGLA